MASPEPPPSVEMRNREVMEEERKDIDEERTQTALYEIEKKIAAARHQIKAEQATKEDNINDYLRASVVATTSKQRDLLRTNFEKLNDKATGKLVQLQLRLNRYHERRRMLEAEGIPRDRSGQTSDVLKHDQQSSRENGSNAHTEVTVSAGGAAQHSHEDKEGLDAQSKSVTGKSKYESTNNIPNVSGGNGILSSSAADGNNLVSGIGTKVKQDHCSIGTSGSSPRSAQNTTPSSRPPLSDNNDAPLLARYPTSYLSQIDEFIQELKKNRPVQEAMEKALKDIEAQLIRDHEALTQALEQQRNHVDNLELLIADAAEQRHLTRRNVEEDLNNILERTEYRINDGVTDMRDLLEACQTRITKMQLQQHQYQQLINMNSIENSTLRLLATKSINVFLAFMAVILLTVGALTRFIETFIPVLASRTGFLIILTSTILGSIAWINLSSLTLLGHSLSNVSSENIVNATP